MNHRQATHQLYAYFWVLDEEPPGGPTHTARRRVYATQNSRFSLNYVAVMNFRQATRAVLDRFKMFMGSRESSQVLKFLKIAQNYKYHLAARGWPPGASAGAVVLRGCDGKHCVGFYYSLNWNWKIGFSDILE
ncbi:hypothetical protein DEO72_LG5g2447 [Vigna unguiculata]|uniref:Uncharacterized protein n=1 Tax=Vigna unguiculata TaxID=3917 RepID=A0A4D6M2T6_VIGUN|nr:hypothetical protein DEO72_LG5g2447 [Vigna unguiculata]